MVAEMVLWKVVKLDNKKVEMMALLTVDYLGQNSVDLKVRCSVEGLAEMMANLMVDSWAVEKAGWME